MYWQMLSTWQKSWKLSCIWLCWRTTHLHVLKSLKVKHLSLQMSNTSSVRRCIICTDEVNIYTPTHMFYIEIHVKISWICLLYFFGMDRAHPWFGKAHTNPLSSFLLQPLGIQLCYCPYEVCLHLTIWLIILFFLQAVYILYRDDDALKLPYCIAIAGFLCAMFAFGIPHLSALRIWLGFSTFFSLVYIVAAFVLSLKDGTTRSTITCFVIRYIPCIFHEWFSWIVMRHI